MTMQEAIKILEIVKWDKLGHYRDLSFTPTSKEIAQAIETVLQYIRQHAHE